MTPDPRTIAADIMTAAARDIDRIDVWSHIGQAYDVLTIDENIDTKVLDLIAKAGIDLIWPDGSKDTELDAARVEIERLTAELDKAREQLFAQKPVIDAAEAWAETVESDGEYATEDADKLHHAVEQYRLMDLALTSARNEPEGGEQS